MSLHRMHKSFSCSLLCNRCQMHLGNFSSLFLLQLDGLTSIFIMCLRLAFSAKYHIVFFCLYLYIYSYSRFKTDILDTRIHFSSIFYIQVSLTFTGQYAIFYLKRDSGKLNIEKEEVKKKIVYTKSDNRIDRQLLCIYEFCSVHGAHCTIHITTHTKHCLPHNRMICLI